MSQEACEFVDQYVADGGRILASGFTSTADEIGNPLDRFRLNCLGVEPEFQRVPKTQGYLFQNL